MRKAFALAVLTLMPAIALDVHATGARKVLFEAPADVSADDVASRVKLFDSASGQDQASTPGSVGKRSGTQAGKSPAEVPVKQRSSEAPRVSDRRTPIFAAERTSDSSAGGRAVLFRGEVSGQSGPDDRLSRSSTPADGKAIPPPTLAAKQPQATDKKDSVLTAPVAEKDAASREKFATLAGRHVTVGMYSGASSHPFEARSRLGPLVQYLAARSGVALRAAFGSNGKIFGDEIRSGVFPVIYVPMPYYRLASDSGYVPIAKVSGSAKAAFVVRADLVVDDPKTLAGKVAVVDPSVLAIRPVQLAGDAVAKGRASPMLLSDPKSIASLVLSGTYESVLTSEDRAAAVVEHSAGKLKSVRGGEATNAYAWWVRKGALDESRQQRLLGAIVSLNSKSGAGAGISAGHTDALSLGAEFERIDASDVAEFVGPVNAGINKSH